MADLIITGFERALIGFRDSSGYFIGQTTSLANGATGSAYVASLVRTASYTALGAVNLDIPGGDIIYSTVQFGNSKTMPFDLILSDYDETLANILSGASSNTTNSMATYNSTNPNRKSARVLALGLQSRAEDTSGNAWYVTQWFPSCQMTIKRNGPGFQALADTVISCTPMMASKAITGQVFGSTGLNMGLTEDKTDNYFYRTQYPTHVMAFKQNTGVTTFIDTYRPVSTTITLNATPNSFFIGGVATALTSTVIATGVNTLTAEGTAGVQDVLIYETEYVPV